MQKTSWSYCCALDLTRLNWQPIEKMCRQISFKSKDRSLQCILWRRRVQEVSVYKLNMVISGTKSAPWLAIRCLKELSELEKSSFLEQQKFCLRIFYNNCLSRSQPIENQAAILEKMEIFTSSKWARQQYFIYCFLYTLLVHH